MLMWHPDATAQAAAAQLTAVLYAVPQISVRLDTLADRHRDVLEFWLGVVARWRPVLQFGRLRTGGAAERFGWARADDERTTFLTTWSDGLLRVDDDVAGELVIVNARAHDGVVVTGLPDGSSALVVHGCDGRVLLEDRAELGPGPVRIDVPAQGLSVLTRTDR